MGQHPTATRSLPKRKNLINPHFETQGIENISALGYYLAILGDEFPFFTYEVV